jgi:hypothetical protein
MRTLGQWKTACAPLKGLARKRPVMMAARISRRDRQAFLLKTAQIVTGRIMTQSDDAKQIERE